MKIIVLPPSDIEFGLEKQLYKTLQFVDKDSPIAKIYIAPGVIRYANYENAITKTGKPYLRIHKSTKSGGFHRVHCIFDWVESNELSKDEIMNKRNEYMPLLTKYMKFAQEEYDDGVPYVIPFKKWLYKNGHIKTDAEYIMIDFFTYSSMTE